MVHPANDRLSSLPEQIVYHIFSFLDTLDVIRLRVVSKKLWYLCASVPYLNFDIYALFNDPVKPWPSSTIVENFKDYVNWVLLSLDGCRSIHRLRISCANAYDESIILRWIYVAVNRNIQEFELLMKPSKPFQLPYCLVNCGSLTTLKLDLNESVLNLSSCVGFPRLKSLVLSNVELTNEELTGNVFSSSPLLEHLIVTECSFVDFRVVDICARNLKNLTIRHLHTGLCQSELRINCLNLVSLNLLIPPVKSFSLDNPSSLDSLFIDVDDGNGSEGYENSKGMFDIVEAFHRTKVLKLNLLFFECWHSLAKSSILDQRSFYNIKHLKLSITSYRCYLQEVIRFLKYTPLVETLQVQFDEVWEEDAFSKIPEEPIECLSNHVKKILLINFDADANQFEFVRFLLKIGLILEKMVIYILLDVVIWDEVIERLSSFPKSSSHAQMIFKKARRRTFPFDISD